MKTFKKEIIIEENEIKPPITMQDFNSDLVIRSCFKLDNVKIQEHQNQEHLSLNEKNSEFEIIQSKDIKDNIINGLDWRFINGKWRCADSFSVYHDDNFNTFGGSLGEFILALHVFTDNTNQIIDSDSKIIYELMYKFLKSNPKKYLIYHSNLNAFEKFKKTIFSIYPDMDKEYFDIYHIKKQYQSQMLELVVRDEFIGCEFIKEVILSNKKSMGSSPKSISPILVKNVIQSFFKIIWNEKNSISNALFEVDDHNDMVAILNINMNPPFICGGPEIYPTFNQELFNDSHKNYMVIQGEHQILKGIRKSISLFLHGEFHCDDHHKVEHRNKIEISFKDYYSNLNLVANVYKEFALNLYKSLPYFNVTFNILIPDTLPESTPLKVNKQVISIDNKNSTNDLNNTKTNNSNNKDDSNSIKNKSNTTTKTKNFGEGKNKSKVRSFFKVVFIILGIGISFAVISFGFLSYKKKKEKYRYHTKLQQEKFFSLEENFENDFDL
ncbi:hypothetical protein RB653_003251 [Dictyostelium firmibasis]|uniref:Uncharacterized protein n=1 Tax=Dictyostelium firmibasis TaxID=79012 RepID=A0AAN7U445_9MYCE